MNGYEAIVALALIAEGSRIWLAWLACRRSAEARKARQP